MKSVDEIISHNQHWHKDGECRLPTQDLITLQGEIHSLRQRLAEAEAKVPRWQKIDENTSRDGRTILGFSRYYTVALTIRWDSRKDCWESTWDGQQVIESQDDFGTDYRDPNPMEYWMPLPAPPEGDK